ncbi:MAG: toll/interleukin-1 receptor domain-containing protein [Janthinobacterium lividum]
MPPQADAPKIFISYSWNPPQHKERVIELAKRLQSDGVDVILDVWDLAPGQDKNVFMEQTVSNPAIKRVLLVCNQDYQRKADGRQGGVGTESLIMSQEVYAHADQTKFIPLVFEVDENGKACVPTFIHSRIYFDLREGEHYEDSYEQLIRNIFDKPVHRKPPLGIRPAYLGEDASMPLLTGRRVEALKRAFLDNRPSAPLLVKDYYATFLKALAEFEPSDREVTIQNFIEWTEARIEALRPLRDDFVAFLDTYLAVSITFDLAALHDFLEQLVTYLDAKTVQTYNPSQLGSTRFDYLRFFAYELALYLASALLKAEKFDVLAEVLSDRFIVVRPQQQIIDYDFGVMSAYNATLNQHKNETLEMRRTSVVGDTIKHRATGSYSFEELKQADLVLYYCHEVAGFTPGSSHQDLWRAETAAYNTYDVPVFAKVISTRYYEKIKVLFDGMSKEELTQRVREMEQDHYHQM